MTTTHWPLDERPRQKLLLHGGKSLSDAELLAIFIENHTRDKNAIELARELLLEFGGLKNLLETMPQQLCEKKGVGKAKYVMLKAAVELGKRFLTGKIRPGKSLASSRFTKRFLSNRLCHYSHEVFACLFLDVHCRVLAFEELFHGTLDESPIYPREIIKRALAHNAGKIILAHNHPSGNSEPSQADHEITFILQQSLALVGIQLVDHVVIGLQKVVSFAERDWL